MTSTQEEIKGENISVKVDRQPGCQITMEVSVSPEAAKAAHKKALKAVNKEVSLPGFRKGRAPDAMIIQNFGKYVDQELQNILLETSLHEALKLANLALFSENSLKRPKMLALSKEEGARIEYQFESFPDIPDVDAANIKLNKVERETIGQEQVDKMMEDIRLHHAEWTEVADREVQENDYIDVDIVNLDQNNRKLCDNDRFHVAEGKMGKWMQELVIGLKPGEQAEGVSKQEEGSAAEQFIPTKCRITVNAIHTPMLPEFDDALAKKVGVNTVEILRERVESDLNKQADDKVRDQLREQLEDFLVEHYPFDIPKSLIEGESTQRFRQEQANLGENPSEEAKAQLKETIAKDVMESFQLFFIARQVAEKNQIEVEHNELLKELMVQMYSSSGQDILASSAEPAEVRSRVYLTLLSQKAKDFLIGKAAVE